MSYINPRVARRRRFLGDDSSDAPVIDVAPSSPDDSSSSSSDTSASTVSDTSGGTFVSAGGVCKATTPDYLEQFKELQRQANRIASMMGTALIAVDGAIGPGTLALLVAAQTVTGYSNVAWTNPPPAGGQAAAHTWLAVIDASSCSVVATNAMAYTGALSNAADALGAASSVASPSPASTPSYVNPTTGQVTSQPLTASIGDLFGNMSSTQQYLIGAGAVALAYLTFSKKKSATSTTRRTTRR